MRVCEHQQTHQSQTKMEHDVKNFQHGAGPGANPINKKNAQSESKNETELVNNHVFWNGRNLISSAEHRPVVQKSGSRVLVAERCPYRKMKIVDDRTIPKSIEIDETSLQIVHK